jgi:hypothetical protein
MESMVIKTIWLAQLRTSGQLVNVGGAVQQTVSIIVGNQTVVKTYQFISTKVMLDKRLIVCTKTRQLELMMFRLQQ